MLIGDSWSRMAAFSPCRWLLSVPVWPLMKAIRLSRAHPGAMNGGGLIDVVRPAIRERHVAKSWREGDVLGWGGSWIGRGKRHVIGPLGLVTAGRYGVKSRCVCRNLRFRLGPPIDFCPTHWYLPRLRPPLL